MPGPFIPIDSIDSEPSMYRFYRRLSSFCRVIRFDHRGMGMSSRIGADKITPACWAEDAVAVMDAVGCERATIFGSGFTAMSALFLAADRPRAGVQPGDRQRRGPRAVGTRLRVRGARQRSRPLHDGGDGARRGRAGLRRPRGHRAVGRRTTRRSATWWDAAGNRAASPSMARRSNQTLADADLRDKLPSITVTDPGHAPRRLRVRRRRARSLPRRAHRGRPLRRAARRGHPVLGRRHHADARRDRGVRHRRARRLRRRTGAHDDRVHRHRRVDRAGRRPR